MSIKDIELFKEGKIDYSKQEVADVLRGTVAKGLTDAEYIAFGTLCTATGLNPIRKEIWVIKTGQSLQIMTGLNGYRAIANSHPSYDGMEGPIFHYDENGNLLSAEVLVYRKDRARPHKGYAILKEVSSSGPVWKQRTHQMLAKCAECDGLRRAFPQEMSGLYAEEEMPSEFAKPSESSFPPAKVEQPAPLPAPIAPQVDKVRVKKLCDALKSQLGLKTHEVLPYISKLLDRPLSKLSELTELELESVELKLLDAIDAEEPAFAEEFPKFVDTISESQGLGFDISEKVKSYHFED